MVGAAGGNKSQLRCVSRTGRGDSEQGGRGWAFILTFPLHSLEPIHVSPDLISHLEAHIAAQEKFSANYQLEGEEQLASAFNTFAAFSQELLTAVRSLVGSSVPCMYIRVGALVCKGMLVGAPRKSSRALGHSLDVQAYSFPQMEAGGHGMWLQSQWCSLHGWSHLCRSLRLLRRGLWRAPVHHPA